MMPMHAAAPRDLNRVFAEALTQLRRRRDRLEIHANQLHDGAAADPRWLGRAPLLRGGSARHRGQAKQAGLFASEALAMLVTAADLAGCAARREPLRQTPDELVRLHIEATIAHEAIGPHAQALRLPRAMTDAERKLVSTATRARRMTLQIRDALGSAQRDRDEARRSEQDRVREQARLSEMKVARVGGRWRHRHASAQTTQRRSAALVAQTTDADASVPLVQLPSMTSVRMRLKFRLSPRMSIDH